MKIKEAYELAQQNSARLQRGLDAAVRNEVVWTNYAQVNTLWPANTHRTTTIRLGLIDAPEPLVIVDYSDRKETAVLYPYLVAQWSWPTVRAFQGLEDFLRRHLKLDGSLNLTHVPSWSWVREAIKPDTDLSWLPNGGTSVIERFERLARKPEDV